MNLFEDEFSILDLDRLNPTCAIMEPRFKITLTEIEKDCHGHGDVFSQGHDLSLLSR